MNKKMVGKTSKAKKAKAKKPSKKPSKEAKQPHKHEPPKQTPKPQTKSISTPFIQTTAIREHAIVGLSPNRIFSINLGTITGDTSIGDLIVAFPRTREVLMKHGLRFDVEEAGYLYMTLNVFSAIHGLTTNNLVQELDVISKEPPPPPVIPQQLRPIPAAPTP